MTKPMRSAITLESQWPRAINQRMLSAVEPPAISLAVKIEAVQRTFPGRVPIETIAGVSLHVESGEFLALLGPSGCGKSTLLRLIAGLDRPDAGMIQVDGKDPGQLPRGAIGYVFQDASLLPWRNVSENVELPLEIVGMAQSARREASVAAIRKVGLAEAATRYPAQLSGGMKMRASLARAMVTRPRLLLLDEPFAALDEINRQSLDEQLRKLWLETGITVVFVTHSIIEAAYLARRVVVLSKRPAHVVRDHIIDLPEERAGAIRVEPRFAQQLKVLYDALAQGTGAA